MIVLKVVIAAVIAYLLGAIPFGLIIGKLLGKVDVTQHGSRSIGSTNVLRTVGTKAGLVVIVLDLGKAAVAVWLAGIIMGQSEFSLTSFPLDWNIILSDPRHFTVNFAQIIAAMMAMIGHNWSIYIKFRGGKGVANYLGFTLVLTPLWSGIAAIAWVFVYLIVRIPFIASFFMIFALATGTIIINEYNPIATAGTLATALFILFSHKSNVVEYINKMRQKAL